MRYCDTAVHAGSFAMRAVLIIWQDITLIFKPPDVRTILSNECWIHCITPLKVGKTFWKFINNAERNRPENDRGRENLA